MFAVNEQFCIFIWHIQCFAYFIVLYLFLLIFFLLPTAGYLLISKRKVVEGSFGKDGKREGHKGELV